MLRNLKDIINYIRPLPLKGGRWGVVSNHVQTGVGFVCHLRCHSKSWFGRDPLRPTHYDFTFFGVCDFGRRKMWTTHWSSVIVPHCLDPGYEDLFMYPGLSPACGRRPAWLRSGGFRGWVSWIRIGTVAKFIQTATKLELKRCLGVIFGGMQVEKHLLKLVFGGVLAYHLYYSTYVYKI